MWSKDTGEDKGGKGEEVANLAWGQHKEGRQIDRGGKAKGEAWNALKCGVSLSRMSIVIAEELHYRIAASLSHRSITIASQHHYRIAASL